MGRRLRRSAYGELRKLYRPRAAVCGRCPSSPRRLPDRHGQGFFLD